LHQVFAHHDPAVGALGRGEQPQRMCGKPVSDWVALVAARIAADVLIAILRAPGPVLRHRRPRQHASE
jgi:hypothetical protein